MQGEEGGEKFQDERAEPTSYAVRSRDGGRTWTEPVPWGAPWNPSRLFLTPGGRLLGLVSSGETLQFAESTDRGRTWSAPIASTIPNDPEDCVGGSWGSILNLDDGAMLLFGAGGPAQNDNASVWTWGSIHCRAYACRSDDDGHTWSDPVNLDGPCVDAQGNEHGGGNLDLTEQTPMQLSSGRVMVFLRPIFFALDVGGLVGRRGQDVGALRTWPVLRLRDPQRRPDDLRRVVVCASPAAADRQLQPGRRPHLAGDDHRQWHVGDGRHV